MDKLPDIKPATPSERELLKRLIAVQEDRDIWKNDYKLIKKKFERYIKKAKQNARTICRDKSKDGVVNVCDAHDEGAPARCNKNTIDQCPVCILLSEEL